MGTITTTLKVTADARAAAAGLRPLEASLQDIKSESDKASSALTDLGTSHKVKIDDHEVEQVQSEIKRLRTQMREGLRADVNMNTAPIKRQIGGLRSTLRELQRPVEVPVKMEVTGEGAAGLKSGLTELTGLAGNVIPALGNVSGAMDTLRANSGLLRGGLVGVGAAFGAWKVGKLAADVETTKIQLKALTGSTEAAGKAFAFLQKFAKDTPFELDQVTGAAKSLMIAGKDLSDLPKSLSELGNVAAATGVPLEQMTIVFGQMFAKGKVSNEELMQLAEAGVPAYQQLAKQLGTTTAGVMKLAEQGKIGADQIDPLIKGLGDLFPTAMADQAESFNGQMSTLKDSIVQLGQGLGAQVLPALKDFVGFMQTIVDLVGKVPGPVKEIAGAFLIVAGAQKLFGGSIDRISGSLGKLRGSVGSATGVLGKLKAGFGGIASAFNPWTLAITAGVALLTIWIGKQKEAKERVDALADGIDAQTGKLNEQGLAQAAKDMAKYSDEADDARVSIEDMTEATFGSNQEFDRSIDMLKDIASQHSTTTTVVEHGVRRQVTLYDQQGQAALDLVGHMQTERNAFKNGIRDAKDLASATEGVTSAMSDGVTPIGRVKAAIAGTRSEVKGLNKAMDTLLANYSSLKPDALSVEDAIIAQSDAFLAFKDSIKENGHTLDEFTPKGAKNRKAIAQMISAQDQLRVASIKEGASVKEANRKFNQGKQDILNYAAAHGFSRRAVARFIRTIEKTPRKRNVEIATILRDKATVQIDKRINRLRKRKIRLITDSSKIPGPERKALRGETTQAKLNIDAKITGLKREKRKLANLGPKALIKMFVDPTSKKKARNDMDALNKPLHVPVKPKVDPKDSAAAKKTLNDLAKPGGKPRQAPVVPKVNGLKSQEHALATLARNRSATIEVTYVVKNKPPKPPRGTVPAGSDGPVAAAARGDLPTAQDVMAPVIAGASLLAAGRALQAAPAAPVYATTPGAAGRALVAAAAAAPTPIRPRETPVQVLLDGAVIADRLDLRRSLAAVQSVRRTA